MKVLIVCSGTPSDFDFMKHQAFIYDQMQAIKKLKKEITFHTFFIKRKGINGYLQSLPSLRRKLKVFSPDIIHAHGGTVAFLCNLQRNIPVISTFHGSDINLLKIRWISAFASYFSSANIYVSRQIYQKAFYIKKEDTIIPCGIDLEIFRPLPREEARKALQFPEDEPYILFGSWFTNPDKYFALANEALKSFPSVKVHEIINRSREEVNLLINGASLVLLTSLSEGSPNVIKEAMACNCPIVTNDVGDVKDIIGDTKGCYIATYDPQDVAEKIRFALDYEERTNGREKIMQLESSIIAGKVVEVFEIVMKKNHVWHLL
jgi:glycosyltransferase involved in cell wall biosynthesis